MEIKVPNVYRKARNILSLGAILLFVFLQACAGSYTSGRVIAVVDGTPVTEADLQNALNVSHRVQDLSHAKSLDLMGYVNKLIEDRLMVDEVARMGLDSDPEIERKVKEYLLRESVMRLHQEEVLDRVTVKDDDMKNAFESSYISLGLIEVSSKAEAERLLGEIGKGAVFRELAAKHSSHVSKGRSGDVVYKKETLTPIIVESLKGLEEGQVTAPVEILQKWYLFKIVPKDEGFQKNFGLVMDAIAKDLRKKFQQARETEVLEKFRQKTPVKIDLQVFDSLNPDVIVSDPSVFVNDKRVIAQVGDEQIYVYEFAAAASVKDNKSDKPRKKDDVLTGLINRKLIDQEALGRHYERNPEIAEQVLNYKEYEMKKLFFATVIAPSIDLSDEKILAYYNNNSDKFKTEPLYRFQKIKLKTEAEAARVLASLHEGADFLWIAKSKLTKDELEEDMYTDWLSYKELPDDLRKQVYGMKSGDISDAVRTDNMYVIYRLKEKTDAMAKPFQAVRESVRKMLFDSQNEALMAEYIRVLRSQANIVVYKEIVQDIENTIAK